MPKRCELSGFERGRIVGLHKCSKSLRQITAVTGHPKSTVREVVHRFMSDGTTAPKPRSGRPKKLSEGDRRALVGIVRRRRKATLREIHDAFTRTVGGRSGAVSAKTLKRALHESGYYFDRSGVSAESSPEPPPPPPSGSTEKDPQPPASEDTKPQTN